MVSERKEQNRYGAIDGLRTIACFGIVMMHMAANNSYEISGFLYERFIPAGTDFVYLFMMVSAFGMCCGYYEKMLGTNNGGIPQVRMSDFYKKRFQKVLPFFAVLCILDFIISPSADSFYEVFADITLLFGFLPDAGNISVIGVGWFLGLIFVFYLIFPFFCVLIENKRRAWISFGISLIYAYACIYYFDVGRENILYSGCFFIAGGLIYLYKNEIGSCVNKYKWSRWLMIAMVGAAVVFYFTVNDGIIGCLFVSASMLLYAVMASRPSANANGRKGGGYRPYSRVLENRFTKFVSGISMEIYLSHMMIFRAVEKLGFHTILGSGWLQYILTVVIVLAGAAVFSFVMQKLIRLCENKIAELRN